MTTSETAISGIPGFQGQVHSPGDEGYDTARAVFNGMIDRRPTMIAVCESTDDVVAAVGFARDEGLPISVYGGGHSVTGASVLDDGLVIDMRGMKAIAVDPEARTARAEAGRLAGSFARTRITASSISGGMCASGATSRIGRGVVLMWRAMTTMASSSVKGGRPVTM